MLRVSALVLSMLIFLPVAGQAQGSAQADGPRHSTFQALEDSQWVRLTSSGVGRRQGRLLEHGPTELVVSAGARPLRIPATMIDTLWTRGNSAKTGAIVGALIGGALGTGLGLLCGETQNDCHTGEAVALFGGIGLGGGGLLGTLFGLSIPRWKRQYP
jgi:hypothetical protein